MFFFLFFFFLFAESFPSVADPEGVQGIRLTPLLPPCEKQCFNCGLNTFCKSILGQINKMYPPL